MLRSTRFARVRFGLLLIVLVTLPAWPQSSTAIVSGTVRDQTSAVIPGAVVTLISKDTNHSSKSPLTRSASTNSRA
jgi:hypothetical protein